MLVPPGSVVKEKSSKESQFFSFYLQVALQLLKVCQIKDNTDDVPDSASRDIHLQVSYIWPLHENMKLNMTY